MPWYTIMARRGKNFCQEKRDQYFTRIGMKGGGA